jgi:transcriptional regulator
MCEASTGEAELHRIIRGYPLGILITGLPDGLDANHIPFELDLSSGPHGTLHGHVARANPVWQQASSGSEVLVVFRGADGYVSPNWYPSKHESHRQVPTWNYEVVHAHGTLTVHDDERYVRGVVARLTRTHESREPQPWKMKDAAPGYIDSMLQMIVGIEVQITRIVGKRKLSQNRELRDRSTAAEELRKRAHAALADAMERAKEPLK